jgi:hypothetical protein
MVKNRLMACVLACAFFGTGAADLAAAPFGYVVNAADPTDDGSHDNLWRVDLESGTSTRIGALNVPNAVNSDVEGLAFESSTLLRGVDDATDSLLNISTSTGAAGPNSVVDNLRLDLNGAPLDPGLGFDCDNNLLMSSATRNTLYRLDKLTGQATVISATRGATIGDIAVRGDEMYAIGVDGDEGLYRLDPATGIATLVGPFGLDIDIARAGLDFDRDGNLWAVAHILDAAGQPQPSRILRIDRTTGAATAGPAMTLRGVKSLAVAPVQCEPFGGEPPPPPSPIGTPVGSPLALALLVLAMLAVARIARSRGIPPR